SARTAPSGSPPPKVRGATRSCGSPPRPVPDGPRTGSTDGPPLPDRTRVRDSFPQAGDLIPVEKWQERASGLSETRVRSGRNARPVGKEGEGPAVGGPGVLVRRVPGHPGGGDAEPLAHGPSRLLEVA